MKITEIQLTNYKAFYGNGASNKVVIPNGENLLIYGENGSGKSSLYEGVRNLFLASNVVDGNAHFSRHLAVDEFITSGVGEEMKTEQVPANVSIILDDFKGNSKEVIFGVNGNVDTDTDVFEANKSNSFLSYRELLKTYLISDVTNSYAFQTNLAELILKDILSQTVNIGNNKTYSQNYKELWVAGKGTRPSRAQKEAIAKKFDIGFRKDIGDINVIEMGFFLPQI
jgi:predicted ATP-binding protein involved in virulence